MDETPQLRAFFAGKDGDGRWFEARLSGFPGWIVAGLFFEVAGELSLGELRFIPEAGRTSWIPNATLKTKGRRKIGPVLTGIRKQRGDWSRALADFDGTPALTARFLHHGFRLGEFEAAARTAAAGMVRRGREDLLPPGWGPMLEAEPSRPGRRGRDDLFYATWAELYVQKAGDRAPIAALAREHPDAAKTSEQRRNQIRDWIREARSRDLLTHPSPGLPGGALTLKGRRVLKEARRQEK